MNKNIEGDSTMKLLNARGLTRTTLLAISASLLATLIMPREAAASDDDDPTSFSQAVEPPGIERPEVSASERAAEKRAYRLKHSYDAGEFYYYQGERIPMRRSLTELVVEFRKDVCEERKRNVIDSTVLDAKLIDGGRVRGRPVSRVELVEPLSAATLDETLAAVRRWPEVKYAFPVFVHPQNGGTAALTDELIVKLRPDVELEVVTTAVGPDTLTAVKKVWGTDDQYILRVNAPKRVSPLQIANQLAESAPVDWATPNFLQEVQFDYTPSDPLYPQQWHLNNEGELEAAIETTKYVIDLDSPADADVDAPEAWDLEQGNGDIVIAIIDSGVDLQHEDLVANLFINEGEIPDNGIDDDRNGLIDDVTGWDFLNYDNEPNDDYGHGTAVAGIAAASSDNAIGVAGVCPRCRILPIQILSDGVFANLSSIAEAVRYAASLADVLNGSWHVSFHGEAITSALYDATTSGRDEKGVISLFASGNYANTTRLLWWWETPGTTHRYRFTYSKDEEDSMGDDTVWLKWVAMPNGEVVTFEDGMPVGWETSGDAPWSVVEDAVHAAESICQIHSLKAGDIGDGEQSHLDIIVEHEQSNYVGFAYWLSSESPGDTLTVSLDRGNDGIVDELIGQWSGVPVIYFDPNYPASLPETVAVGASSNWDCRSAYSQFGASLDFLAPSGGG
ncbi:MAG: S8 family serine peptidase, partial [Gammaproteobacteria bacterium]